MRIHLDSPIENLAFRFKISAGYTIIIIFATIIIFTTIIFFLARELKPLVYWPTPRKTVPYKHIVTSQVILLYLFIYLII